MSQAFARSHIDIIVHNLVTNKRMRWQQLAISTFCEGQLNSVDCFWVSTNHGTGLLPREFLTLNAFILYSCDFLDITFQTKRHMRFTRSLDIFAQYHFRLTLNGHKPCLHIKPNASELTTSC